MEFNSGRPIFIATNEGVFEDVFNSAIRVNDDIDVINNDMSVIVVDKANDTLTIRLMQHNIENVLETEDGEYEVNVSTDNRVMQGGMGVMSIFDNRLEAEAFSKNVAMFLAFRDMCQSYKDSKKDNE